MNFTRCLRTLALGVAAVLVGVVTGCGGGGGGGGGGSAVLPPSIVLQPIPVSVSAGAPATFTVTASGDAPLSYQWRRDGVPIAGATAASYTLAATALGDNGAGFNVNVSNPAGAVSSTAATLSVTAVARSWGPAVLLSSGDTLHTPTDPRVAIDTAGNAISVWQEAVGLSVRNAVWGSRYRAGSGWGTAATIDDPVGNSAAPQLAMAPSGVAMASFVQSTSNNGGGVRMLATRLDGTAWSARSRLDVVDAAIDADHRLAIATDGAATVAFNQSDNLTGRRATAAGSSATGAWALPEVIGATRSYEPQVALAANGDAVMAWLVTDTPSTSSLWASRRLGAAWSAPVRIVNGGKEMAFLRLRADAAGDAIAVWQQRPTLRTEVRATRLSGASGAWSVPVALNDGTLHAQQPELAMRGTGDTIVVWSEASDIGQASGLVMNRYVASNAAWSGPARVQPIGASAGVSPSLAHDGSGNAIAVWLQSAPANPLRLEVWAASFDPVAARWATPTKLMTDPAAYAVGGQSQTPAIAINAAGDAVVVWFQRTDAPFALGIWARVYR